MTGALLYEQLADDLAGAIRRGSLRPGDRMPSVRGLATQRKVAVATVLQAYLRLEDEGFIEMRPRSGHFVKSRPVSRVEEPLAPRRNLAPATVSVTLACVRSWSRCATPTSSPWGRRRSPRLSCPFAS